MAAGVNPRSDSAFGHGQAVTIEPLITMSLATTHHPARGSYPSRLTPEGREILAEKSPPPLDGDLSEFGVVDQALFWTPVRTLEGWGPAGGIAGRNSIGHLAELWAQRTNHLPDHGRRRWMWLIKHGWLEPGLD